MGVVVHKTLETYKYIFVHKKGGSGAFGERLLKKIMNDTIAHDYSGERKNFGVIRNFSDEDVLDIAKKIRMMLSSDNKDDQHLVIYLCGELWFSGHDVNGHGVMEDYCNNDVKSLLTLIAGGKYSNFTPANVQFAKCVLFDCLENYILKLMVEKAPNYTTFVEPEERRANTETMLSECYIQMVKDLPKYDPSKSQPLTFFNQSFFHAISEFKNSNRLQNLKPSVSNDVRRVATAAAIIKERGGDEEDVAQLAAELSGMSFERIFTTLGIKKALESTESMENKEDYAIGAPRAEWLPETATIKHELKDKICEIIHALPVMEKTIFCLSQGISLKNDDFCFPPLSVTEISSKFGMKKNEVESYYHWAINDIKEQLVPYLTGTRYDESEEKSFKSKQEVVGKRIHFAGCGDDDIDEEIREIVEINVNLNMHPSDIPAPPDNF